MSEGVNDVLEGFLCPICKRNFRSPDQLTSHFKNEHSEDQDVLKSLKDLVGKATQKILSLEEVDLESFKFAVKSKSKPREYEVQELGRSRSYIDFFKAVRSNRMEHFATETNQLLIRLDRLLTVDNSDRRQHEQMVVQWLDGTTVNLCPSCAKTFNITRRQHHCRLCGSVMCHVCSYFLPLSRAKSMTGALMTQQNQPEHEESESLRVCRHCLNLLESRHMLQERRLAQPPVCELYNKLRTLIKEVEPSIALYNKMCASLHCGEATYNLPDAQMQRRALAKYAESMDTISKHIVSLEGSHKEMKLHQAIRRSTTSYIKEHLLNLPKLPTLQELEALRRSPNRTLAAAAAMSTQPVVVMASGWTPTVQPISVSETEETDPIIVQMDVIRGYIREARKALRFEEVALLEGNLRELQNEYYNREQIKEKENDYSNFPTEVNSEYYK